MRLFKDWLIPLVQAGQCIMGKCDGSDLPPLVCRKEERVLMS